MDPLELAVAMGSALTEMVQAGMLKGEVRVSHDLALPGRQRADVRVEIDGAVSLLDLVLLLQVRGAL